MAFSATLVSLLHPCLWHMLTFRSVFNRSQRFSRFASGISFCFCLLNDCLGPSQVCIKPVEQSNAVEPSATEKKGYAAVNLPHSAAIKGEADARPVM